MIARFGAYEIDLDKVEIRLDGEVVPVQPQVFSVIEYLIAERERAVTKEELLDNIWGDRFVSESALTSRIKSARQALGDSGAEQRVIKTIVGRGYRFVAELETGDDDVPPDRSAPPPAGGAPPLPAAEAVDAEAPHEPADWPMLGRSRELDLVTGHLAERSVPGVLITGPEQIGASRFVDTCRAVAHDLGHPTARVIGIDSAASIPLAAIAHLLPDDVLSSDHDTADLARADIAARARRALEDIAGERRLVVTVENASQLDTLSSAVLSTLMLAGTVFGLVLRRPLASQPGESPLREVALPRLDETTIDILLHRVLHGPIAPGTLRRIVDMSNGRPGLVRDLVETSMGTGALVRDHGVWRLVGPLSSTARQSWNPDSMSPEVLRAAQILALLPELTEADATDVIGDSALDELDAIHLLTVEPGPNGRVRFSLVDPLLAATVREAISPLRRRRLEAELAERLVRPDSDPRAIATIVSWPTAPEGHDDAVLLAAAQSAMIEGDMDTAGVLVEHIVDHENPAVNLIEAEVALRRSQWERAERLFEAIDVTGMDEMSAAHVLRRQAAIQFYNRSRYDETIDWLGAEADRRGGRPGRALRARRVGMLAYLGRVDDVIAAADELGDMHGLTAIEVLLSTATADLLRGTFAATLETVDRIDALIDQLPAAWADEPRDGAVTLRCSALFHIGRIDEAADLARRHLPLGKRTELGYFPSLAAVIELVAGRPRAAREVIRPAIQSSHREAFPHYLSVADVVFAVTDLARGDLEAARAGLDRARRAESLLSGELHWLLAMESARLAAGTGEASPHAQLLDLAPQAAAAGALMREADLLSTAAVLDPTTATAIAVADRVEQLVADFDGTYWPLRAREIRSRAEGADHSEVADAFRRLGYAGHAD